MNTIKQLPVFVGKTLTTDAVNNISERFPIGGLYHDLDLFLHLSVTHSSESGAIVDGEERILKGLTLRTDKGEYIVNNIPGRALFYRNALLYGKLPYRDAIAAASSAVYDVHVRVPFANPRNDYPFDTRIDSRRYNDLFMSLDLGGLGSLFGVTTGAALAITADCYVHTLEGDNLPEPAKWTSDGKLVAPTNAPMVHPELLPLGPIDPSSVTELVLEKSEDLSVQRIYLATVDTLLNAGVAMDGTLSNTTVGKVTIDTNKGVLLDQIVWKDQVRENALDTGLATALTGFQMIEFNRGGSLRNSLSTGEFTRLRALLSTITASTSQVYGLVEGVRKLR